MRILSLNILALATQVVYAATILESIQTVNTATGNLGNIVRSWKGDFFGTLPIIESSGKLLCDINDGTKAAKASAPLDFNQAIDVAGATITLSGTVNSTLQSIIDRKPDFQKLLLNPVILGTLKITKSATDDFSAAIEEKVPSEAKPVAQELIAQIQASFQEALDAYKLF